MKNWKQDIVLVQMTAERVLPLNSYTLEQPAGVIRTAVLGKEYLGGDGFDY